MITKTIKYEVGKVPADSFFQVDWRFCGILIMRTKIYSTPFELTNFTNLKHL